MKVHATSFGFARSEKTESQDSFDTKSWGETVIAVIADGVGSARDGREASARIVKTLISNYAARPKTWSPEKSLTEFAKLVNRTLYQESLSRYGAPEMISTLSVAVIEGDKLYGLNVGDSRVYLARDGRLTRLSNDHVEENASFKHVLKRAIGLDAEVEPHCFEMAL